MLQRTLLICGLLWLLPRALEGNEQQFQDLLNQYKPHLFATFAEFSPPVEVESMLDNGYLVNLKTAEVVRDQKGDLLGLTQEVLRQYNHEDYAVKLLKDYTRLYGDTKKQNFSNSHPVVYARAVKIPSEHILALQYFFFYPGSYTGKLLIPLQMKWHEGDTEYAQILLNSQTLQPIGATSSIHYYGYSLGWNQTRKAEDGRIKMYIAQHSHATYFSPSKGRGHQAMVGNLGFGGDLIVSLKTVWDVCKEDQEIHYKLLVPAEDSMVFKWKGRWGAKKHYVEQDEGAKSRELGPRSFAFRNSLSERLSMWQEPAKFAFFYYHPSELYQRLILATREIREPVIMEKIYDLMQAVGRLRAQVDYTLMMRDSEFTEAEKRIIAEATPFVVFAKRQAQLQGIYAAGQKEIGAFNFRKIVRTIAKKQMKILNQDIQNSGINVGSILDEPLDLFTISSSKLAIILASITGISRDRLYQIYKGSSKTRIGDVLYTD
jgi:hypothetical protein